MFLFWELCREAEVVVEEYGELLDAAAPAVVGLEVTLDAIRHSPDFFHFCYGTFSFYSFLLCIWFPS
jgi:hypothetical protein